MVISIHRFSVVLIKYHHVHLIIFKMESETETILNFQRATKTAFHRIPVV